MYHDGELEIQRRAGGTDLASRVGRIIGDELTAQAAMFFAARTFVIAATVDADGAPHASLLGGIPGFAHAEDPKTLLVAPAFGHLSRVADNLAVRDDFGLLAIDFANKRRMRVNGRAVQTGDTITVTTAEVYANCPQYIHTSPSSPAAPQWEEWVANSDTFFIASVHPSRGADASHRGGPRGFLRVASASQLVWPDYSGNNMFNTLGNLTIEPRAALLFVDFTNGETLELRGRARVAGDTEREVVFEVEDVTRTAAEIL